MGLLDKLRRRRQSNDIESAKQSLAAVVVDLLTYGNDYTEPRGLLGIGGLSGLLQRFSSAGFGPEAASWVGNGPNLPVATSAVEAALGDGVLRILAQRAGLDEARTARYLSTLLPDLIDRLTPNGDLPESSLPIGGMDGTVESLNELFVGHTKFP